MAPLLATARQLTTMVTLALCLLLMAATPITEFQARVIKITADLVGAKVVTIRMMDVDRYGRIIAIVVLSDGRDLGKEVSGGKCSLKLWRT